MIVTSIDLQTTDAAQLVAAFNVAAPAVRARTGCVRYDLLADTGQKQKFLILHIWDSQEALDAYRAGDEFKSFAPIAKPLMTAPAVTSIVVPPSQG